jgi:hypothetical protein
MNKSPTSTMAKLLIAVVAAALFNSSSARRVQTKDELYRMEVAAAAAASTTPAPPAKEPAKEPQATQEKSIDETESKQYVASSARTLATTFEGLSASIESMRRNTSVEDLIGKWVPADVASFPNVVLRHFDIAEHGIAIALGFFCVLAFAATLFRCTRGRLAKAKQTNRKEYKYKGRVIYEWEQFETYIMMYIELPKGMDKNDLDIRISPRHMRVGRKGKHPFIKEELYLPVDDESSSWKANKCELEICLIKEEPEEWQSVLLPHLHTVATK